MVRYMKIAPSTALQPASAEILVGLKRIAEHGQVVYRAEGRRVLELQRQAVVEEVLAGLIEKEACWRGRGGR